MSRFNIIILAISFVAGDKRNIGRIARNGVVAVNTNAKCFQFLLVGHHLRASIEAGEHDASDEETVGAEGINQP